MSEDGGRVQQTGQTAKEQTSAVAAQAQQAAGEVAGTATQQAKTVAGEARAQAGSAIRDLGQRLLDENQGHVERLAGTVRQWADDLAGMAQNASGDSPARDLTAQAADQGHRAADYLDKAGLEGMADDLRTFARRRPAAFLGGAALAGLVVGRLAKAGTKTAKSTAGPAQDVQSQEIGHEESSMLPPAAPLPTPVPSGYPAHPGA
ncbi:hypothetical protein [Streptomyces sp. NPDC053367]|uniref:hypothetical protein n=1 Tax=Streptomyces sp. NPDC053367 TaxID=3365700 RepID=UPI0037D14BCB